MADQRRRPPESDGGRRSSSGPARREGRRRPAPVRLSRRELLACAPLVVAACAGAPDPAASGKRVTHTVKMDGTRFEPETLVVKKGDAVTWINADPFPHTATSEAGRFDSGQLAPGASWTYEATSPGEFPYVCTLHPTMTGTLRVT